MFLSQVFAGFRRVYRRFVAFFRGGSNAHEQESAPRTLTLPNELLIPTIAEEVREGKTVTLRLFGNSMLPFLHDGRDKGLLVAPRPPQIGEPVLAKIEGSRYVLHRVVAIDGEHLTLLGDGNLAPEYCLVSDIQASVEGFYRKGSTKLDRIDGRKWRIYSAIWMRLRPIRRYLLAIYRRIIRVF